MAPLNTCRNTNEMEMHSIHGNKTTSKKTREPGDEKDEWQLNDGGNTPYIGFVFLKTQTTQRRKHPDTLESLFFFLLELQTHFISPPVSGGALHLIPTGP